MSLLVIAAFLFCGMPFSRAEEVAQDLDPMVSPDAAATMTSDNSVNPAAALPVSDVAKSSDAVGAEKKALKKEGERKGPKSERMRAKKKKQNSGKKKIEKKKQHPGKSAKHKSPEKKKLLALSTETQKVQ